MVGSGEVLRVCVLCAVKYCACECTVRGEVLCYSVLNTVNDVRCTYNVRRVCGTLYIVRVTVYNGIIYTHIV